MVPKSGQISKTVGKLGLRNFFSYSSGTQGPHLLPAEEAHRLGILRGGDTATGRVQLNEFAPFRNDTATLLPDITRLDRTCVEGKERQNSGWTAW